MSNHASAKAQARYLEKISDENMIHYFKNELEEIRNGTQASSLFNDSMVKSFVRMGILAHSRGKRGHTLTVEALNILQKLFK